MPAIDRVLQVPRAGAGVWGSIRLGGPCRDDYARIVTRHTPGGRVVVFQRAAMESLVAMETRLGFEVRFTGTARACSVQAKLYASDRVRFAPPEDSYHCRALAGDIDQNMEPKRLKAIDDLAPSFGWHKARPTDEPWHISFGGQG
jgi:hypothetical protein